MYVLNVRPSHLVSSVCKLLIWLIESALYLLDVRGGLEESGVTNKE